MFIRHCNHLAFRDDYSKNQLIIKLKMNFKEV
nr:MAG TPA: hypothetical protein [Caudoviricetes sp.]